MAKILGIVGIVGSLGIGGGAYWLYSVGKPGYAAFWGVMALIWVVCAAINFRTARRQSRGY